MTEILTDRADAAMNGEEEAAVGVPPVDSSPIESILEDDLIEDVSIDGMCGVY
jgi:mycofactocin precursor